MLEDECLGALREGLRGETGIDDALQVVSELRFAAVADGAQQGVRELAPDRRRQLRGRARLPEPIETGGDGGVETRRNQARGQRPDQLPRVLVFHEHARFDHLARHLFDEEGYPLAALDDLSDNLVGQILVVCRRADHRLDFGAIQP